MPLAYLFVSMLDWGSVGIYTGMCVANILCAVIMIWIFLQGRWTQAVIPTSQEQEAEIEVETGTESLDSSGH